MKVALLVRLFYAWSFMNRGEAMVQNIPNEVLDEVRSQVNILDIVSQYVQLKKQGSNWFGICPFHAEKTPSFSVNEEKQIFNCFSCHRGGNVYKFMMEIEGLGFVEAFRRVAELGNVEVSTKYLLKNAYSVQATSEYTKLKDIQKQAAQLYHHVLVNTQIGEQALNYLHERGLSDELIAEFELGYAPSTKLLIPFFKERQIDEQLLQASGLFTKREDESLHDRFIDRVMFPLKDMTGQIIGFSGRKLTPSDNQPKYLNSPETKIFNKRELLFNMDKAKVAMRLQKKALLCEGFMDVLAAYRAGVKNATASMGTSLTEQQIAILSRFTDTVVICYDGDDPGQQATKRALSLLEKIGKFKLEVVSLPEKLDPDEYIKKYGEQAFQQALNEHTESPMAFYMRYFERGRNLNNETEQLAYINDILEQLANVKDSMERMLYLNRLSERFKLDKASLEQRLSKFVVKQKTVQEKDIVVKQPLPRYAQKTQVEKAEELLLYRILHEPEIYQKISELENFIFVHEKYQVLYILAQSYFKRYAEYQPAVFFDVVQDKALQELITEIDIENDYPPTSTLEEINDCLGVIAKSLIEQKINELINQVGQTTDEEKRRRLLEKITELSVKRESQLAI